MGEEISYDKNGHMNLQDEMDAIAAKYGCALSCDATRYGFETEVRQLVYRIYVEGGYLLDHAERPILTYDEVGIAVCMGPYSLSATTYRLGPLELGG
jgi:hypothetical protein